MDITSFLIGYKSGAAKGGGSVEGVHFVTFMSHDGTTELYKRPVADGDDCADPVKRGYISAPTKASTAQYTYSHVGWATTPNGAWDENALKAVTEDKTVYAAYASAVRYYTITYYDSDGTTVLKTESLTYGSTPSYAPTKTGFFFEGWTPELATVTGATSYIASWAEKLSFADATWADIARVSAEGKATTNFEVGDTKTIPITYDDGTTGELTLAIAGFNHDTLADGSGTAGMSIICVNLPNYTTNWADAGCSYVASNVNAALSRNGDVWNMLPSELTGVIKDVTKKYDSWYMSSSAPKEATFTLWALSLDEIGHSGKYYTPGGSNSNSDVLGTKYDYFTTQDMSSSVKNAKVYATNENTDKSASYHLRHTMQSGSWTPYYIECGSVADYVNVYKYSGDSTIASRNYAIRFGFCV